MKLVLVNICPEDTIARYLLSSYLLKAYLGQVLPEASSGLTVEVLNFSAHSTPERMAEKIAAAQPQAVGYSCYIWNVETVMQTAGLVRQGLGCPQILGGPEIAPGRAGELARQVPGLLYVVGEGELPLAGLVGWLQGDQQGPLPPGVLRFRAGQAEYEPLRSMIPLSEVPSVYLEGALEPRLYQRQQVFLETQRGCRYRCRYCVYHKGLPTIRLHPLERVLAELDHLVKEAQVTALRIIDPIFTSDLERAKRIAAHLGGLQRAGARLPWIYWEFVYNMADEEFLAVASTLKTRPHIDNCDQTPAQDRPQLYSDLLKDYTVINCVGLQSLHGPSLKAVGRPPVDQERFAQFMETVRRHNLVLKIDMIMGLPLETPQTYLAGLERVLPFFRHTDHVLNIHRLQVLPGSDLEGLSGRYGLDYARQAPHLVHATADFLAPEMARCARLSGLLFRVLNSPLREALFQALDRCPGLVGLLEYLMRALEPAGDQAGSRFLQVEVMDDMYWNRDIYRDIPSAWLGERLADLV